MTDCINTWEILRHAEYSTNISSLKWINDGESHFFAVFYENEDGRVADPSIPLVKNIIGGISLPGKGSISVDIDCVAPRIPRVWYASVIPDGIRDMHVHLNYIMDDKVVKTIKIEAERIDLDDWSVV